MRILGPDACVHVLPPIAVGPAIESAFADGSEIVGDEVRTDFVALVHDRPQLTRPWLNGERGGVAEAGGVGPVRAGLGIHLPHHCPVGFGRHPAFGDVAVGADADVEKTPIGAGGQRLGPVMVDLPKAGP